MIKRAVRALINHEQVLQILTKFANQLGYGIEVFDDQNLPTMAETMLLFYRARFILAPHGAGLSTP